VHHDVASTTATATATQIALTGQLRLLPTASFSFAVFFHNFLLSLSSFLWHGHFLYNGTTIISVKLQRQRQQHHIHNSCLPQLGWQCLYHSPYD